MWRRIPKLRKAKIQTHNGHNHLMKFEERKKVNGEQRNTWALSNALYDIKIAKYFFEITMKWISTKLVLSCYGDLKQITYFDVLKYCFNINCLLKDYTLRKLQHEEDTN